MEHDGRSSENEEQNSLIFSFDLKLKYFNKKL